MSLETTFKTRFIWSFCIHLDSSSIWMEWLIYIPLMLSKLQVSTDVLPVGTVALLKKTLSLQFKWKLERYSRGFRELLADLLYERLHFCLVESKTKWKKCLKAFSLQLNIQAFFDKYTSSWKKFKLTSICGSGIVRAFSRRSTTYLEIIQN